MSHTALTSPTRPADQEPLDLDQMWAQILDLEQTGRPRDFRTSLALRDRLRDLIARSGYSPRGYDRRSTHTIGQSVYLTIPHGLIACRTLCPVDPHEPCSRLIVAITGPEGPYRRHAQHTASAEVVAPRLHVTCHGAGYRIHPGWRWIP